jgi:hypothetical protein
MHVEGTRTHKEGMVGTRKASQRHEGKACGRYEKAPGRHGVSTRKADEGMKARGRHEEGTGKGGKNFGV